MATAGSHRDRARRLASGPQLYVLNREGVLEIRQNPRPDDEITSLVADKAIKASIAATGRREDD